MNRSDFLKRAHSRGTGISLHFVNGLTNLRERDRYKVNYIKKTICY